jgi:hypothetical protein
MTAIGLFDALAGPEEPGQPEEPSRTPRRGGSAVDLAALAGRLVAEPLEDVRRIREYERQFIFQTEREPAVDLEARRSVWRMFEVWAEEAEQVLSRAASVARSGAPVAGVAELEDAVGRVRARLTVRPEQIARAREQEWQRQFVPVKELRGEFHARLHPYVERRPT